MEQNSNIVRCERSWKMRPCLGCHAVFSAEGPFNRVCPDCKSSEEWQSGGTCFEIVQSPAKGRDAANDNDVA